MRSHDRQAYQKHIADIYDERSGNHNNSGWHRSTALKLVDELPPRAGHGVLDIGTGTGTIAFRAAELAGPQGRVIGVDISQGMLAQANKKLRASRLRNLEFVLGDAEKLAFPDNSFDRMYCASAFFCVLEPLATLRHWHDLLKPGGGLGFHALPATSYFWVSVARDVLAEHGFQYLLNAATGTVDKTRQLLSDAGFVDIDIRIEETGYFVPLEKARQTWIQREDFAPGQYPHPVHAVPPEIMIRCRREYEQRIEALSTDEGVWNDITMYYVYAFKAPGA